MVRKWYVDIYPPYTYLPAHSMESWTYRGACKKRDRALWLSLAMGRHGYTARIRRERRGV